MYHVAFFAAGTNDPFHVVNAPAKLGQPESIRGMPKCRVMGIALISSISKTCSQEPLEVGHRQMRDSNQASSDDDSLAFPLCEVDGQQALTAKLACDMLHRQRRNLDGEHALGAG